MFLICFFGRHRVYRKQIDIKPVVFVMLRKVTRYSFKHRKLGAYRFVFYKISVKRGIIFVIFYHIVKQGLPTFVFPDCGTHAVIPQICLYSQFFAPAEHFFVCFRIIATFNDVKACRGGFFNAFTRYKFLWYTVPKINGI